MPLQQRADDLPSTEKAPFRLALYRLPVTTVRIKRALRKLGISSDEYRMMTGGRPMNHFARNNPDWTMRELEVLLIENAEQLRNLVGPTPLGGVD